MMYAVSKKLYLAAAISLSCSPTQAMHSEQKKSKHDKVVALTNSIKRHNYEQAITLARLGNLKLCQETPIDDISWFLQSAHEHGEFDLYAEFAQQQSIPNLFLFGENNIHYVRYELYELSDNGQYHLNSSIIPVTKQDFDDCNHLASFINCLPTFFKELMVITPEIFFDFMEILREGGSISTIREDILVRSLILMILKAPTFSRAIRADDFLGLCLLCIEYQCEMLLESALYKKVFFVTPESVIQYLAKSYVQKNHLYEYNGGCRKLANYPIGLSAVLSCAAINNFRRVIKIMLTETKIATFLTPAMLQDAIKLASDQKVVEMLQLEHDEIIKIYDYFNSDSLEDIEQDDPSELSEDSESSWLELRSEHDEFFDDDQKRLLLTQEGQQKPSRPCGCYIF